MILYLPQLGQASKPYNNIRSSILKVDLSDLSNGFSSRIFVQSHVLYSVAMCILHSVFCPQLVF